MDLNLILSPVDSSTLNLSLKQDSLYHSLHIFKDKLPEWEKLDVALIGINDYRGQETEVLTNAADKVRKRLYELKQQKHTTNIADLGNLKIGKTLLDTQDRLAELCKVLFEYNVVPLIIGGSHDLDLGQFYAYQGIKSDLNVLTIDSSIDVSDEGTTSENHSIQMLCHEPNYLFNYAHLGYQVYLNHPHTADILEKMNCDHVRLGLIADDIKKAEPYVRFADMISFDVSAIKQSDFTASFNPQPFGLTAEYACQMSWYAGISNNCSSFGIYGYYPELDGRLQNAGVIAVMVWYFIEGYYHRQVVDVNTADFKKFIVEVEKEHFLFYKDIRNEMWWTEVDYSSDKKTKKALVPCSYSDYLEASGGEIPQRLFDMRMKYSQ